MNSGTVPPCGFSASVLPSSVTARFVRMNLFDYVRNDKQEKLDQALDSIRQKYGSKAVMRGSFLEEKRPPKATPYD